MTTIKLTGHAAIAYTETAGGRLSKHTDPTEGARDGLTVEQGRAVAAEDPSLVFVEASEYGFGQAFDHFDRAGFRKGYVKADGSWSLT